MVLLNLSGLFSFTECPLTLCLKRAKYYLFRKKSPEEDMIKLKKSGNLLKEETHALVNTVNCVGIMGKGIALQFKMAYPDNFKEYKRACDHNKVKIGEMFITRSDELFGSRYIINFPTKVHWREKSKLKYIEKGLDDLVRQIKRLKIESVAIPPLGCGNGGLNWKDVKKIIENKLSPLKNVDIILYAPSKSPEPETMRVNTNEPRMTAGRASLIGLLKNYKKVGYKVTLLEIQKLMYFLQESGENLRLDFQKAKYGPYANNLHHVLQRIEKHFISGYGDRTSESHINLLPKGVEKAEHFLEKNQSSEERFRQVKTLIEGFETPYGLELLSTIHWTVAKEDVKDIDNILEYIKNWNQRKKELFDRRHVEIAKQRLEKYNFL